MSACTFFGHRDCPSSIKSKLREVLINLIENHSVDMFYVGQQGAFDAMVRSVLKELVSLYPHINYAVVLERMPPKRDEFNTRDYSDTMLPEGIETVHPRFAIPWRNKWMLKQSSNAITHKTINHTDRKRQRGCGCIDIFVNSNTVEFSICNSFIMIHALLHILSFYRHILP